MHKNGINTNPAQRAFFELFSVFTGALFYLRPPADKYGANFNHFPGNSIYLLSAGRQGTEFPTLIDCLMPAIEY
jgi:hypothetical protein